jgi:diadenosine tetraphosphate (Ap4A) HIT family hydrolase
MVDPTNQHPPILTGRYGVARAFVRVLIEMTQTAPVPTGSWGANFSDVKRGEGCPMCGERSETTPHGRRFMAGRVSDAYLGRYPVRRGYAYVIWRGRHVAEPTELHAEEASEFWAEVAAAACAIEARYEPMKMNWLSLGNGVPHLHVHLVPRHADDRTAGGPLESEAFDFTSIEPLSDQSLSRETAALALLVALQR